MYKPLNQYFDHTLLTPDATTEDIKRICDEAVAYSFYAVCVNGSNVRQAAEALKGTGIKIAAVIGFPLGASTLEVKAFETADCCENGADEIDMVMNIGALKEGRYEDVKDDIAAVVAVTAEYGAVVKVILETALLTEDEIKMACELSLSAGAEFVKTCTGFRGGASAKHVALMNACVGNLAKVKASGGIRNLASCIEMIDAGADRIGSSSSVAIMEEYKQTSH